MRSLFRIRQKREFQKYTTTECKFQIAKQQLLEAQSRFNEAISVEDIDQAILALNYAEQAYQRVFADKTSLREEK